MSFTEYLRTTGLPWGQDMGWSVLASSASSQSILFCSSGMLTLMAAWHAMEAAMRARIFSRFSDCSSRENWSSNSCSICSTAAASMPAGHLHGHAAGAEGLGFESVVLQFVRNFREHRLLRGRQLQHDRHEKALAFYLLRCALFQHSFE